MQRPAAAVHAPPTRTSGLIRSSLDRAVRDVYSRSLDARAWGRICLGVDVLVLALASCAALFADPSRHPPTSMRWLTAAFPLVVLVMMHARRTPDERLNGSMLDTCAHVLGVVSLATMLTIAADSSFSGAHPLGFALRLWLFAVVWLSLARSVLLSLRRYAVRTDAAIPTLIVGAGAVGAHLVKRLIDDPGYGLRPVGFLDSDPYLEEHAFGEPSVPVLGGPDDLAAAIEATGAGRVILAFSSEPDHVLVAKVRQCQRLGVDVSLVPRLYESINERTTLDHVGGLPLLTLHSIDPRGWQFAVKHTIDRGFALLGLIALSPIVLMVAVAVRLSSSGTILFRQRRVGRDGHEFDLLKFRTMRDRTVDSHAFELIQGLAPGGVEGEDRRTGVGRLLRDLSLDELPQLINVLRGDMSLVGPRPERPEFVERFVRDVTRYEDRHRVKSGITGWAQVNGLRGQTSIADRVEWDNYYIQNWSLRLDLRILALTIVEVLRLRDSRTDKSRPRS
jgi:exopolysaccharide biosynthesis polyprenyl glycosylphosphotransferase